MFFYILQTVTKYFYPNSSSLNTIYDRSKSKLYDGSIIHTIFLNHFFKTRSFRKDSFRLNTLKMPWQKNYIHVLAIGIIKAEKILSKFLGPLQSLRAEKFLIMKI